jgi:phosphomannomutase
MLAALHAVAALGTQASPLSKILKQYQRYFASGEINSIVSNPASILVQVEASYGKKEGVSLDHLDGLTVSADAWWFNLRPSNTEPLLRLNVEAKTQARLERVRDEVLALIRG